MEEEKQVDVEVLITLDIDGKEVEPGERLQMVQLARAERLALLGAVRIVEPVEKEVVDQNAQTAPDGTQADTTDTAAAGDSADPQTPGKGKKAAAK